MQDVILYNNRIKTSAFTIVSFQIHSMFLTMQDLPWHSFSLLFFSIILQHTYHALVERIKLTSGGHNNHQYFKTKNSSKINEKIPKILLWNKALTTVVPNVFILAIPYPKDWNPRELLVSSAWFTFYFLWRRSKESCNKRFIREFSNYL